MRNSKRSDNKILKKTVKCFRTVIYAVVAALILPLILPALRMEALAATGTAKFGSNFYTKKVGETFPLGVYVEASENITHYEITLSYDTTYLKYNHGGSSSAGNTVTVTCDGDGTTSSIKTFVYFEALAGGDTKVVITGASAVTATGENVDITSLGAAPIKVEGEPPAAKEPDEPKDPSKPEDTGKPEEPGKTEEPDKTEEPGTEDSGTEDSGIEDSGTAEPGMETPGKTDGTGTEMSGNTEGNGADGSRPEDSGTDDDVTGLTGADESGDMLSAKDIYEQSKTDNETKKEAPNSNLAKYVLYGLAAVIALAVIITVLVVIVRVHSRKRRLRVKQNNDTDWKFEFETLPEEDE